MLGPKKKTTDELWLPKSVQDQLKRKYICLWEDEQGRMIGNENGDFLVAESFTWGDKAVEAKMRNAVRSFGIEGGRPVWQRGRKVTAMEHDDQMERMLAGEIPDERDASIAEMEEEYLKSQGHVQPNEPI